MATIRYGDDLTRPCLRRVQNCRGMLEVRELRAADRMTAAAATNMGARTSSAVRADRFHQIAERPIYAHRYEPSKSLI